MLRLLFAVAHLPLADCHFSLTVAGVFATVLTHVPVQQSYERCCSYLLSMSRSLFFVHDTFAGCTNITISMFTISNTGRAPILQQLLLPFLLLLFLLLLLLLVLLTDLLHYDDDGYHYYCCCSCECECDRDCDCDYYWVCYSYSSLLLLLLFLKLLVGDYSNFDSY